MTCKIMVITEAKMSLLPNDFTIAWAAESSKIIDHANSADRKWFGTHCFWAMRNNRKVTIYPIPESN